MNQSGYYLLILALFFIGAIVIVLMSYTSFSRDVSFTYSTQSKQQMGNIRAPGTAMKEVKTTVLMEELDEGLSDDLADLSDEMIDMDELEALETDLDDLDKDLEL